MSIQLVLYLILIASLIVSNKSDKAVRAIFGILGLIGLVLYLSGT